jgi:selenocysteine lyase/cysteine desulfurase
MSTRQPQTPLAPLPATAPATLPAIRPAAPATPVTAPATLTMPPTGRSAVSGFLQSYPEYAQTATIDVIRAEHYGYLDRTGHAYLDYTGSSLVAGAQLRAHLARLEDHCFGNPHTDSPASQPSTELVEQARAAVLRFLHASPQEYTAIFTPNATGACRLVGEAYPFGANAALVLTFDNHNSVNGIREYARARGAATEYIPTTPPDLRTDDTAVHTALQRHHGGLFAYPAQSNFTGVQHPLDWVEVARENGYQVLLDAAAYIPTNTLDLSAVRPDFVTVSWYKVFGYPTGVGCLVARRDALARLHRPWFSGGTIQVVSVAGDWYAAAPDQSAFEDGTLNFLNIPDVEFGITWVKRVGIDLIHRRVGDLTGWLLDRLTGLRHSNGNPMVRLYGPATTERRGATVAFNLLDPAGRPVDERIAAREITAANISVRTGCFCNPGAGEGAFEISGDLLHAVGVDQVRSIDQYLDLLGLPTGGAIRASLGLVSNLEDVERFCRFLERTYRDRHPDTRSLSPRLRC